MTARRPFEVAALALVLLASSAEAQPPPDVTPPSVRAARPPRWPEGASADGEVEVRLRLTVGADGRVRAVDLVGRAGPLFDAAALRHAVGLRFEPSLMVVVSVWGHLFGYIPHKKRFVWTSRTMFVFGKETYLIRRFPSTYHFLKKKLLFQIIVKMN